MNRRQCKKQLAKKLALYTAPDTIESLVGKATHLAAEVNAKTEYCIFVDFAGHVDMLKFDIRKSKQSYSSEIAASEFYINPSKRWSTEAQIKDNLNRIIGTFQEILTSGELPYERFKQYDHIETRYAL